LILQAIGTVYGAAAAWRRRRYTRRPELARRLDRPVISIGNLTVGGSGKTPAVEYIARLLLDAGERPSILTRGYGRSSPRDGVTVVSDAVRVLASLAESGDEPLMLARALPGVPVLVGADRYLSGRLAEERFGATVHLLDDGFQHLALARDVDLLLVEEQDLDERVLPAGRLREPIAAARAAHAVVVTPRPEPPGGGIAAASGADAVAHRLGVSAAFTMTRRIAAPPPPDDRPVVAVAGIARPQRFFDDVRREGWRVAETFAFRDHHVFRQADVDRIRARAEAVGAGAILTTAKDAIRLEPFHVSDPAIAVVPLMVGIEPADLFRVWLLERLHVARAASPAPSGGAQSAAPAARQPEW
jgi:tetraacyldisaccharide 4'-kinase